MAFCLFWRREEFEPSRRFPTYTSRHLLKAVETGDLSLVSMQLRRRRASGPLHPSMGHLRWRRHLFVLQFRTESR
jgi:hypothetical protein